MHDPGPLVRLLNRPSLGAFFYFMAFQVIAVGLGLLFFVPDFDHKTTGEVVGHNDTYRGCQAVVGFEVGGVSYEAMGGSNGSYCPGSDHYSLGDPVEIYYDETDPSSNDFNENATVTGIVVLSVGVLLAGTGFHLGRRAKKW